MTTTELAAPDTALKRTSLVTRFAQQYGIEPSKMLETLKMTCFKTERGITHEQMASLLLVCEANGLNPFVRQLHALLDKQGNVVPFVGIDGWISLVNRRPEFDGVEFDMSDDGTECECTMWRRDRSHPTKITEYLAEVKRGSTPWSTSPRRMLRHRAYAQCARIAFGFPGLHDEYDARIIASGGDPEKPGARPPERIANVLSRTPIPASTDLDVFDEPPPKTLAAWIDEMMHAPDQETSLLVVDEARGQLPDDQHAALHAAYLTKWTPKE